jgi:hypothetical protein
LRCWDGEPNGAERRGVDVSWGSWGPLGSPQCGRPPRWPAGRCRSQVQPCRRCGSMTTE